MASSLSARRLILFLAFIYVALSSAAPFPLPAPQRPTTFPLTRPAAPGFIAAWGDDASHQRSGANGLGRFVVIAGGVFHNVAVDQYGFVRGWGRTNEGQLIFPPNLTNVVAVSAGFYHSLALTADGGVIAWGGNTVGQSLSNWSPSPRAISTRSV